VAARGEIGRDGCEISSVFFYNFGDDNWRQVEAWIVLLAGAIEVNALAQGALRQFTQWLWIEYPTFQLEADTLPLSYCRPWAIAFTSTAAARSTELQVPLSYN